MRLPVDGGPLVAHLGRQRAAQHQEPGDGQPQHHALEQVERQHADDGAHVDREVAVGVRAAHVGRLDQLHPDDDEQPGEHGERHELDDPDQRDRDTAIQTPCSTVDSRVRAPARTFAALRTTTPVTGSPNRLFAAPGPAARVGAHAGAVMETVQGHRGQQALDTGDQRDGEDATDDAGPVARRQRRRQRHRLQQPAGEVDARHGRPDHRHRGGQGPPGTRAARAARSAAS